MKKKEFEFFTTYNEANIYIEDREEYFGRYAVYHNNSVVNDCLTKKQAIDTANFILREA